MDGSEVLDHVGAVEVVALDQAPVGDGGAADVDLFFLVGEVDDQTDVVGDGDQQEHETLGKDLREEGDIWLDLEMKGLEVGIIWVRSRYGRSKSFNNLSQIQTWKV